MIESGSRRRARLGTRSSSVRSSNLEEKIGGRRFAVILESGARRLPRIQGGAKRRHYGLGVTALVAAAACCCGCESSRVPVSAEIRLPGEAAPEYQVFHISGTARCKEMIDEPLRHSQVDPRPKPSSSATSNKNSP